jgi:RNA polymerase sigma factor (sigma-70 family)
VSDAGELSDAELLARVAERARDASAARQAEALFYGRHVRYLYGVLLKRVKGPLSLSGQEVEDLVQETFFRVFERAHTFRDEPGIEPERAVLRVRAWLGRIAQNLLADSLARAQEVSATPYLEGVSSEELAPESTRDSPELGLIVEALDALSERERDVLRVAALYHRLGEAHQRLPNAVSAELALRWETTSENIRAIRSRAMKKLRDFLKHRGQSLAEPS